MTDDIEPTTPDPEPTEGTPPDTEDAPDVKTDPVEEPPAPDSDGGDAEVKP